MKTHLFCASLLFACSPAFSQTAAPENAATTEEQAGFKIFSTDWGFTLQLKSLEQGGLGLDYSWVPLPRAREGEDFFEKSGFVGDSDWSLLAEIKAEGFLAFGSDDANANSPKALNIEGNLFTNIIAADIAGQDWWVDVGVSAFQLEADQDFERINYVARPYLVTPIPASHLLSRVIHKMFGVAESVDTDDGGVVPRSDRPIYLRAGYALVSELKDDGNPSENRAEFGVSWQVKLYLDTTFNASYRHFLEDGEDYGFLDLTLAIPLKKDFSVLLKYIDGELPPSLGKAQSVSAGFSISF